MYHLGGFRVLMGKCSVKALLFSDSNNKTNTDNNNKNSHHCVSVLYLVPLRPLPSGELRLTEATRLTQWALPSRSAHGAQVLFRERLRSL